MRVPRTFSFVDLSGFTNYTAAFGDDAAGRILSAFRSLVREIASERGVRIAKWLGDGCMVVSIEQSNAVAFALDLEHKSAEVCAPLSLRVGMATGHALLFEGDDYIGSAVNMAARLCDAAGPFEVLMPTMQIERLPRGVTANAARARRAARLPRADRRGRTRRAAGAGRQHRHRRTLDSQPLRVIRASVVPQSRLDRALFHEDLILLQRPRCLDRAHHARTGRGCSRRPARSTATRWSGTPGSCSTQPVSGLRCNSRCSNAWFRSGSTTTVASPTRGSQATGGRDGSRECRSGSAMQSRDGSRSTTRWRTRTAWFRTTPAVTARCSTPWSWPGATRTGSCAADHPFPRRSA